MKNVMVVSLVVEGRFGLGSWSVMDGENVVKVDEDGEVIDSMLLDDLEGIEEGEVLCGSEDDGGEYVMWVGGKEGVEKGREEFVKFGESEYGMGVEFGEWFDKVVESESGVSVDLY